MGVQDRVEIWDKELWEEKSMVSEEDLDAIAERMEAIGAAYQPVNHLVKDHTDTGRSVQKMNGRGR